MNEDSSSKQNVTQLLAAWGSGDKEAVDQLMPLVEAELRRIASNHMRKENGYHTLQTTALINEAYMKLIDQRGVRWQNRAHFFALSATLMRRILINHARDRHAEKRGGRVEHVDIADVEVLTPEKSLDLLALDEALEKLAKFDKTKSQIVELRYFGGLTIEETAEALGIAAVTVSVNWRLAKAWLTQELEDYKYP
jgi:RNA polymerase sigma factor (TIGR02999 family)